MTEPKDLENLNIIQFAYRYLGIPLHEGQLFWLDNSTKRLNILKPANQWGKTTVEAIKHIYHANYKPQLNSFNMAPKDKFRFNYKTLNFGKTYEVSRGVMEHIIDITEGRYLLSDGTFNKSILKGWAITDWNDSSGPKLPQIKWWNNSITLIRSYDGLGEAFKRLRLAFISGDECGDIPELKLFVTGTLLPRLFFFRGSLDLVGTSQPEGVEYEDMAEEAEEDMRVNEIQAKHFIISARNNPDMANIYTNKFMPRENIEDIEDIADPELKRQIIYGFYVDWSKHLYTWAEINQMFKTEIPYDFETGFSEEPIEGAYYAFATDLAAAQDETSCTCIRYNIRWQGRDDKWIVLPHKIVFHKAWKGESLPLPLQYEMIKSYFRKFKEASPHRSKFIYDAGSLGGRNAGEAFRELSGYPFPPKGRPYHEVKAEGMGKVKEVLGKNRKFIINEKGQTVDQNENWGGVKASPKLKELRRQLEVASKDDDKLKNDQYTSFMMALHFIESRTTKLTHTKAVNFNYNRFTNTLGG